jgi:Fic family protein
MPQWDVRFDLKVDFSNQELVRLAAEAHAFASVIREIPIPPYLQQRLDAVNILRAVRGTTAIEGANASTEEIREIMQSPSEKILPPSRAREEQEVRNAQDAMYYVATILKNDPLHPLTESLICELHRQLTQGIDYESNIPGSYRSHAVHAQEYRPPGTGEEVRDLMKRFVDWANTPPASNWDPILRALAAHFYLISIHPFADGNGRTSRAVESFLLYQGKVNARGFYSLANFYYQNRTEYVQQLDHARFTSGGNLTPFMLFATRGLVEELKHVHSDVIDEVKVISFRDYAREQFLTEGLLGTKAGVRGFELLMRIDREPLPLAEIYSLPQYKNVTMRTIQRDLKFLGENNLIVIENGELRLNIDLMSQFTAIEELEAAIDDAEVDDELFE